MKFPFVKGRLGRVFSEKYHERLFSSRRGGVPFCLPHKKEPKRSPLSERRLPFPRSQAQVSLTHPLLVSSSTRKLTNLPLEILTPLISRQVFAMRAAVLCAPYTKLPPWFWGSEKICSCRALKITYCLRPLRPSLGGIALQQGL